MGWWGDQDVGDVDDDEDDQDDDGKQLQANWGDGGRPSHQHNRVREPHYWLGVNHDNLWFEHLFQP